MVYVLLAVALGVGILALGMSLLRVVEVLGGRSLSLGRSRLLVAGLLGHGSLAVGAGLSVALRFPYELVCILAAVIVLAGICFVILDSRERARAREIWDNSSTIFKVSIVALLLVSAAVGLNQSPNLCDDVGRYFYMGQRLWDSGDLFDPFSNWRVTVPGGSLYLQSLGVRIPGDSGPYALDLVSGQILLLALAKHVTKVSSRVIIAIFGVLIALTNSASMNATNSVPRFTPLFLMVGALILIFGRVWRGREMYVVTVAAASVIGICGAIRPQFLFFLVVAIFVGLALTNSKKIGLGVVAASGVFLAPWLVGSYRDAGTPLYLPFLPGNSDPNWSGASLPSTVTRSALDRIIEIQSLPFLLATVIVLILSRKVLPRRVTVRSAAVLGAAFITGVLFAYLAVANEQPDISRYVAPIIAAGVLVASVLFFENMQAHSDARTWFGMSFTIVVLMGLSAGKVGVLDVGAQTISDVSSTLRRLTTFSRDQFTLKYESNTTVSQRHSIGQLMTRVSPGNMVLTAIDRSELALMTRADVGILGMPGWVYPKPHNLSWSLGLSPEADVFTVKLDSDKLILNEVYPLVEFGRPGAADLIGIRRTALGPEVVVDHWGFPIQGFWQLPRSSNSETSFDLAIDRPRGLIRVTTENGKDYQSATVGGTFHDTLSDYIVGANSLGFSTVTGYPRQDAVDVVKQLSKSYVFYDQLLEGLKTRKVDYLLVQSPRTSQCLYNPDGWIRNASAQNLYQSHAPYFFAWNDFVDHVRSKLPTVTNGDFSLIQLR